jgi:hypothetical protein
VEGVIDELRVEEFAFMGSGTFMVGRLSLVNVTGLCIVWEFD